jgi:hypothetical protein
MDIWKTKRRSSLYFCITNYFLKLFKPNLSEIFSLATAVGSVLFTLAAFSICLFDILIVLFSII